MKLSARILRVLHASPRSGIATPDIVRLVGPGVRHPRSQVHAILGELRRAGVVASRDGRPPHGTGRGANQRVKFWTLRGGGCAGQSRT